MDRLAQPAQEVLVEHPQDNADISIEAADHQGRGDVDEIVADENELRRPPG